MRASEKGRRGGRPLFAETTFERQFGRAPVGEV